MRVNLLAFGNDSQNQKKGKKTMGFSSLCLLDLYGIRRWN